MTTRRAKTTTGPTTGHEPASAEGGSSRERLITAAIELFGRCGLEGATIRDLAAAADVNIAAVHYHFGGKEELYAAVIERVFADVEPLLGEFEHILGEARAAGTAKAAEKALTTCICKFMHTLFRGGERSWTATFLSREQMQPTPAMKRMMDTLVRPTWGIFIKILDLLRPDLAGTEATRFIASSILGQCLYYQHELPILLATFGLRRVDTKFVDRAAAHVARFSLKAARRY